MKSQIVEFFRELFHIYTKKRIPRSAAELSFFLTLSVFPFLICLNAMLGSLDITKASLISMWQGIIPADALGIIGSYIEYVGAHDTTVLLVAGITLMATSSSAAFRSIMNIMADIQGKSRYSGIFGTIFSFLLSIVFLAVIYLSGAIIVAGGWLLSFLGKQFGFGSLLDAWLWIRFILLFVMLYAIIYGIYVISAPRQKPRIHRKVGTLLASLMLVGVSIIYSWFINMSVNYTLVYGSLASIIILMLWLFTCGIILITGNVVNIILHKQQHNHHMLHHNKNT